MKTIDRIELKKPEDWLFWLIISFILKGLIFIFALLQLGQHTDYIEGFWGERGGDSESYLLPIENLINIGNYDPDYRMPGYGVFYLPLYALFSKATALNILILLQFIFAAIATYLLALIAKYIFKHNSFFYLTFFLYGISTYTNLYDKDLLTESFTTSFLIFSVFFFLKWTQATNKYSYLMLSGLCITEVIFLRPVFFPLLFLLVLILIMHNYQIKLLNWWKPILTFLFPFLIIDGLWIFRNYQHYNKIIPLMSSLVYPGTEDSKIYYPTVNFLQSWGGSFVWWEKNAEIRWFEVRRFPLAVKENLVIPKYIYTSKFNEDSLKIIKEKIIAAQYDTTLTIDKKNEYENYIKSKLTIYTNSIKQEKPFLYYVKAPLIIAKKFFIHSGTYNLFKKPVTELNKIEYLIKIFYFLFYLSILGLGTVAMLLLARKSLLFRPIALVTGIVFYTATIHPFILRYDESRYFVPAWPFLVICAVYTIVWIYNAIFKPKTPFLF